MSSISDERPMKNCMNSTLKVIKNEIHKVLWRKRIFSYTIGIKNPSGMNNKMLGIFSTSNSSNLFKLFSHEKGIRFKVCVFEWKEIGVYKIVANIMKNNDKNNPSQLICRGIGIPCFFNWWEIGRYNIVNIKIKMKASLM